MGPKTLPTIWDTVFGHKLHIGTPHRGKRFWTHQIPTSCLPTWLIFIHIEHNYVESGIKHHNPNPGNIVVSTYNKYYNYHQPLFDHHLDNLENQEILEKKP
jgi:hypothetical protein